MYVICYDVLMQVGITKLRQDLFRLADQALAGEPISFTYKNVVFRLLPDGKPSKLSKLTPQTVLAPKTELDEASRQMLQEMQKEWEQDWADL
jgi:antitoxin (DNA-binding transcriptional repressor) of toxin-antitoxin stability system